MIEVLHLVREGGDVCLEEITLRGHVEDSPDARSVIAEYVDSWTMSIVGRDFADELAWGDRWHGYARKVPNNNVFLGGWVLRKTSKPGRGAFPITVLEPQAEVDARIARQEREAQIRAAISKHWPDAEVLSCSGFLGGYADLRTADGISVVLSWQDGCDPVLWDRAPAGYQAKADAIVQELARV